MQPNVDKYLVVIAGPTAVGKTEVAIALAEHYNSVIVSADSRQIFREMNIGTAKPHAHELDAVPHYFINHLSISEPYSAGRYAHDCMALLKNLFKTHDLVFLVGGAGLYIRAIIEGFDKTPDVPHAVRSKWEEIFEAQGLSALQRAIQENDPEFARQVDLHNHRRLIRALSLIEVAGKPVAELRRQAREELPFRILRIFCNRPRGELYERIHTRVDTMVVNGLFDEVESLLPYRDVQAMQTVGYKEIVAYFDGELTKEEAIAKVKQHSCNYAKRQLTWFRNQGDWEEFDPPEVEKMQKYIDQEVYVNGKIPARPTGG